MKRSRLVWAALLATAILATGCARGLSRQQGDQVADAVRQAIAQATLAAEEVKAAVAADDSAALKAAYQRFSAEFEKLLGPVSLEDPLVAQQMANANSTIKQMVSKGQWDARVLEAEVAALRQGLQAATVVMAGGQAESGSARQQTAQPAAGKAGGQGRAAQPAGGERSAQVQRITVVAVNYRFQPPEIRVKKGTRVTIRLENRGTVRHEFEIEELDFEIGPIAPGTSAERSFVAEKAGRFKYECHVHDHLERGMEGILIVEE